MVEQLMQPEDLKDYSRLLSALGSENNPSQWLVFMDTMQEVLPEVLSSGRPSKKAIDSCLIGRMGFTSWKQMVETSVENGGFGWTVNGWNSFRRAYKTVTDYPYLRKKDLRAGWINKYANVWRDDFPQTETDFDDRVIKNTEESKTKRKEKQDQRIADMESQIATLGGELEQARATIQTQIGEIASLSKQASEAATANQHIGTIRVNAEKALKKKDERIAALEADLTSEQESTKAVQGDLAKSQRQVKVLESRLKAQPQGFWPLLRAAFASLQAKE